MKCKLCNKEFDNLKNLSKHLVLKHKISTLEYYIKYEDFKIPKCKICGLEAKYKSGLKFRDTCGNKQCISIMEQQKTHTEETKEILKQKRLEYMKNNPENTAWRLGNKPSYPEQTFINILKEKGLLEKFNIIREKCFYPYYADFAFENVKVVVEIDGSQHKNSYYQERDKKKEELIISKGWRIYRVSADKIKDNPYIIIDELLKFIGDVKTFSKTSEIITGKQKKDIELQKQKILLNIEKEKIKRQNIQNKIDLILNSNIDFSKYGWVQKVSEILKISPQKVSQWMKRNMLEFYNTKCFKRK
jgi:very-short-patch-repair endonuclease